MNVSSRVLKAHLWQAWASSGGATPPTGLQACLQAQAVASSSLLAAGEIKSNNANGHVTEFFGEGLNSEQVVQIWVYLSELFDIATQELKDTGTANPTDTQVKAQMEADLRPVKGATDNYMWLMK